MTAALGACVEGPGAVETWPYAAVSDCATSLSLTVPREGGFFFSKETTIDEAVAMHVRAFAIAPEDEAALRACARRTHAERNPGG